MPRDAEARRAYYRSPEFKAKRNAKNKDKYNSDPEYRGKVRAYQKKYRNSEEGRARSREQITNWLKKPANKIRHRLRTRMYHLLKGIRKTAGTEELVGCSANELKAHLESQFKPGMSWDNYGEWHVDHIKPCVSFDLTNEEEQRKCFHFTNLQPLWAEENLAKGTSTNPLTSESLPDTVTPQ